MDHGGSEFTMQVSKGSGTEQLPERGENQGLFTY